MLTCLLKRVLPFALTFIIGAALGNFFYSSGARRMTQRIVLKTELIRDNDLDEGHPCKHSSFKWCKRNPEPETMPLFIYSKPGAHYPHTFIAGHRNSVWVNVTFGADGQVQKVKQLQPLLPDEMLKAVESAARQIQFRPEKINGLFVSVTKDVEIHLGAD